jgi:succinate dehydrogenase / fumarate reductase iron-sulfur subunit
MTTIELKIFRFDPDRDSVPYYQQYTLPWTEGLTLLMAVRKVYETIDPTLGFRNFFCGRGLCASCLMTVNGSTKKSCHVVLEVGREYVVEPAKGYPIIRDLVVDYGAKRTDSLLGIEYNVMSGTMI